MGGKASDLGNYNVYEHRFLQSCHLNCISRDLYGTDLFFFLVAKPPGSRSTYAPSLHISSAQLVENISQDLFHERGERCLVVG